MALKILLKIGFGYHKKHLLQTFLILIGIALGVAVVVAIDIANSSVSRSFQLSTESLTGKTTHQIIGSQGRIDERVFRTLRVDLGHRKNAPVVEGYVQIKELGMRTMKLLGVDPFSESDFRNILGRSSSKFSPSALTGMLAQPHKVLISEDLAKKAGIPAGKSLTLFLGNKENKVEVYGYLKSQDKLTQQALSGVIITDISTAQEILKMGNQISRIDLIVKGGDETTLNEIADILPPDLTIVTPQKRSQSIRQMSQSFELNLMAMSLLALLVGMFLIYNTITFAVVQRRKILGILRSLGVTRGEIFILIITETIIFGAIGSILGLGLGILLGQGTVHLVSQSISDLYFVLSVRIFDISSTHIIKAMGLGILASFFSALFPALESVRIAPVVAQRRSSLEEYTARMLPRLFIAGLVLLAIGSAILIIETRQLVVAFGGLLFIVFGAALLVPLFSKIIASALLNVFHIRSGLGIGLALRNVTRSLSRSAVSISALMIAVSVIVGVGIMVDSFRYSVVDWLKNTIKADIYIVGVNREFPVIDASITRRLAEIPGIKEQYVIRSFKIASGNYAGVSVMAQDREIIQRKWTWKSGDKKELYDQFRKGGVFVSEIFAWKNGMGAGLGNSLNLITKTGLKPFPVVGIFQDFSSRQGMIVMDSRVYQTYWLDSRISGIALTIDSTVPVESVIEQINRQLADKYHFMISSNASIRKAAIDVFDRTFTIIVALQILAALVAFIGVFNSIMSMMLERTREIGILRASGMTRFQLWRMVMAESGIIGGLSGIFALPLGTALAWILVYIINKRSFGWSLDFVIEYHHFAQALGISVLASLTAGVYPSYKIGKQLIVDALRTE